MSNRKAYVRYTLSFSCTNQSACPILRTMAWNNGVQDINTVLRSHLEDETKVVWLSGEELFSRPDLLVRPIIKWKCSLMADTMFAGNNGWSLAFPLLVMQSEGGLYVLDGNHRIGAIKIILKRDPQRQLPIPCWLLSASTPVEICRDYATIVNAIQCLGNDRNQVFVFGALCHGFELGFQKDKACSVFECLGI